MTNFEIRKIDIKSFGCYKDYRQHDNLGIGNDFNEGRVNIFYGRNYSGKSTYSKIFQSIEFENLPDKYGDIDFEIKLANGTIIKSEEISNKPLPLDCKVFNQRFIDENINLHDDNKLNSFQVSIGRDINAILQNIDEIKVNKLEPSSEKLSHVKGSLELNQKKLNKSNRELESKLRDTASEIKNLKNPSVITGKKYDITDIRKELKDYSSYFPIIPSQDDEEAVEELNKKIKEAEIKILEQNIVKPQRICLSTTENNFDFHSFLIKTKDLLSKVVSINDILDEYKNDPEKINWIKDGVAIHEENPEKCIFCGNKIDSNIIDNLKSAFSNELSSLEEELTKQRKIIVSKIEELKTVPRVNKDDYFKDSKTSIDMINKNIENIVNDRISVLDKIKSKINEKQRDVFLEIEIENFSWQSFSDIQNEIDKLFNDTLDQIEHFEKRKQESVTFLRRYYIAKKFPVSEFNRLTLEIERLKDEVDDIETDKKAIESEINKIKEEIDQLESSLKSESEAVNRINMILQNSLAHAELSLESKGDEESIYFEVFRNKLQAYNLSEGEKSLIAFAYYIAKLESLSAEDKAKTVLFIDDPISSLDENNIFYIYNLIYILIEKKEFLQYFISTHNLDFLKYTNRFPGKSDYYLIEKIKESHNKTANSYIKKMPIYLYKKVTEFVYLFEQIYKVADENENENNFSVFYNFPNNARKFIETLLYFKYPEYKTNNKDKIKSYFGNENAPFIQRINNEYSHTEGRFDRTRNSINTAEFKHDAIIILKVLYKRDKEQFESFLKNSNLDTPAFLEQNNHSHP